MITEHRGSAVRLRGLLRRAAKRLNIVHCPNYPNVLGAVMDAYRRVARWLGDVCVDDMCPRRVMLAILLVLRRRWRRLIGVEA